MFAESRVFKVPHWLRFNLNIVKCTCCSLIFFLHLKCSSCPVLFIVGNKVCGRMWLWAVCGTQLRASALFEITPSIARFLWRLTLTARCCDNFSDTGHGDLRTPVYVLFQQLTASLNRASTKSNFESDLNALTTHVGLSLLFFLNSCRSVVLHPWVLLSLS